MTALAAARRLGMLAVLGAALLAALTIGVTSASADAAGNAYKADIAAAKSKRSAALKKCKGKPTKAKRRACKTKANAAFARVKEKAAAKRDKARETAGGGKGEGGGEETPAERRDAYLECIQETRDPRTCKEQAKP